MFLAKCIPSSKISKSKILEICKLKNQFWKFTIKKQLEWFNLNIKPTYNHICLFYNNKIVGYTLLIPKYVKTKKNKKFKFYLIDTVVIDKNFRNKKLSSLIMSEIEFFLNRNNKFGILICDLRMVEFYKKYSWNVINEKKYNFDINLDDKILMGYNNKKFLN